MAFYVVYDWRCEGEDSDSHYGPFDSAEEAERVFSEAYSDIPEAHNAIIVQEVRRIKPHIEG